MSDFSKKDFSSQNLAGKSFKGLDLTGSNFSGANLRGTNFTDAILEKTNFSYIQAGLKSSSVFLLTGVALFLFTLAGLTSGFTGYLMTYFFQPKNLVSSSFPPGLAVLILLGVFFLVLFQDGIRKALTVLGILVIISALIAFPSALVTLIALLGIVAAAIAFALTFTITGMRVALSFLAESVAIAAILGVIGSREMTKLMAESSKTILLGTELFSILCAIVLPCLSAYLGWRAVSGDDRFHLVRQIVIALTAFGKGTSFCRANLTDANFTSAELQGVDFREANLTRTCWFQAKKLEYARVGDSILSQPDARALMVTGQGRRGFLVRMNLRGANLAGADLKQANLSESDLREANFQGAYLNETNLSKTLAQGTDFRQARLTGICIEGWEIDRQTQFDAAICHYVFLSSYPRKRYPQVGHLSPEDLADLR